MKLLKVFNSSYLHVFQILAKSFCDPELTEDMLLQDEVKRIENLCSQADGKCKELFHQFDADTKDNKDAIFAKDPEIITGKKLGFLNNIQFHAIWARCVDTEKEIFWKNLLSLCRYCSMLKACGEQLGSMEDMALDFMEQKKDIPPEEYHMALFQEMLAGGDMSKKLVETFKDPNCIKNILANVGEILRKPKDESGDGDDFTDILKMASMFEDSDMEELQKGLVTGLGDGDGDVTNSGAGLAGLLGNLGMGQLG
jgi:hypothetical protein